ncbi:MMPL family transporter [Pradoshia sp.]
MYTYRKAVVTFWVILTITMGFFALKMPGILQGSGFEMKDSSYDRANKLLEEHFGQSSSPYIVLFENSDNLNQDQFKAKIQDTLKGIDSIDGITSISSPLENTSQLKKNLAYASISFEEEREPADNIHVLEAELNNKSISLSLTGGDVIEEEMNKASQKDLKNAELIGVPVAMIVLLLAFGGLVAAIIPLLTGAVAVVTAMGIIYFLGQVFNLSVFVLNVAPMIGLAVSIDFALLYINRFKEELKQHNVKEAVSITTKTAGRAIAFSGICVILGLSGMLFIQIDIFRSVAVGGIVVVLVSVISALTFLPGLLSIMGQNINKAMILKNREEDATTWRKFASFVMKKPILSALTALAILLLIATPIRHIELEIPNAESLPANSETRIAYETFEENFQPEDHTTMPVVLKTDEDMLTHDSLKQVEAFVADLKEDSLVTNVDSLFTITNTETAANLNLALQSDQMRTQLEPALENMVDKDTTYIMVEIDASYDSAEAKEYVRDLQDGAITTDLTYTVGGRAKFNQEIYEEIGTQTPKGLLLIVCTTFLILMFAFRSILIPLKAILMNILSLGAAFGLIVWIFQEGHLGVDANPIALMIPIFIFAIVFGLSMDYEVFLISRIREIYLETGDNDKATLEGLTTTSRIITSAAAIMIAVTGAFAFTDIVPVKQVGVGVALAIFIDATLIRMVLVPSLMRLLGKWNWWFPGSQKLKQED